MEQSITDKTVQAKAVLVSLMQKGGDEREQEASFAELARLCDTAGAEVIAQMVQAKDSPDPRTLIGSGKVAELRELCAGNDVNTVVFDGELSPSQIRNLEDDLGGDIRVIDRSMLILDIFALHAVTGEGKLQVELAQLGYTVPRLQGRGTELSRLGGGIGTRGPGESQLETDRRHVKRRMDMLREQIAEMAKNRSVQHAGRERSGIFKVAIAGYTNAGKSTLLNRLTGAGILAEDKLFATLDPTTRKFTMPDGEEILLTDTVGFIRHLPHHLIEAFKSTLEEVCYADAILVMIDASDPESDAELAVTESLISELGAGDKPILYVYNKCDQVPECTPGTPVDQSVCISAVTGEGLDELIAKISGIAKQGKRECLFEIPNDKLGLINTLYENATVISVEYGENGATVDAIVDARLFGMLQAYRK
ncbi:MAG: GTPase HflX [Ruminococcus sp.]|nr:GTPase HflX [Candidatus Apopatosoma intestinale]